jgi:hypothetical protein
MYIAKSLNVCRLRFMITQIFILGKKGKLVLSSPEGADLKTASPFKVSQERTFASFHSFTVDY